MSDFSRIIGHEQILLHLQTAIEQNKISHAYIINGEKGSGKKMIAEAFVRTLQCEENKRRNQSFLNEVREREPVCSDEGQVLFVGSSEMNCEGSFKKIGHSCGVCKSCIQIKSGNHPDIHWVKHQKVSIGVDDIREQINNDIWIKPYSNPYKIYIMEDADKMTEQAQNALLKTIEEPPVYGVILLLTNNCNRLLTTILSRCVLLELKMVDTIKIKAFLMEQYHMPDYMAELSANFSQGNVGKAIRYATSENFTRIKDDVLHLLHSIDMMEISEIMSEIKKFSEYKSEINDYIDLMMLWYRDVLMLKVTNDPNILLYKSEYKYISRQASTKEYSGIEAIIKAMDKAKTRLNANVNFDTTIELMLFTLKEN